MKSRTAECCGEQCTWDPLDTGVTVGGLSVRGAWVCRQCGSRYIGKATVPTEAWKLAKSGRSIDTGRYRIRVDGSDGDTEAFMERLVKLPDLEVRVLELERTLRDAEKEIERLRAAVRP